MDLKTGIYIAVALLFAFLMTYATTPLVRRLAIAVGAVDIPKDNRRMHKRPMPTMGGLAIFLSFTLGAVAFVPMDASYTGLLLGACVITLTGILDDIYTLGPWQKLLAQIGAALIVTFSGVVIEKMTWFDTFVYFGDWAIPITVLWIVGITNTINLIDGLDGLACGVAAISSLSLLTVSILSTQDSAVITLASLLAGACLGFLPYNRYPAKLFMGDTGAMFLGFVLATISIQGFFKVNAMIAFVSPLLVMGVPILDTLVAVIRRLAKGQHPFHPDKQHFHHKLIALGLSQRQAVQILYAVSALLGIAAVLFAERRLAAAALIMCMSIGVGLVYLWVLRRNHQRRQASAKAPLADANKENT